MEAMIAQESVGDRIRFFRKERDLTQEQLGQALGAGTPQSAKAMVAKIEGGQVPGGLRLKKIAAGLKCSADILLTGSSRELFEVIRYYVRPRGKPDKFQLMAFRSGRIMLHCALAGGAPEGDAELLEAANRLFYLSETRAAVCRKLFAHFSARQSGMGGGDILRLATEAMREGAGADPADYAAYRFAHESAAAALQHYIRPQEPRVAVEGQAAEGAAALDVITYSGGEDGPEAVAVGRKYLAGLELARVEGGALEPLARAGQWAVLAPAERQAAVGDVVACWVCGGVEFGRLAEDGQSLTLFGLNPAAPTVRRFSATESVAIRVVAGVLFE